MTAVVGLARCPGYAGSNDKWDIRMLNDVNSDSKQSEAKKMYDTYARMAFISIIAMVFPMHACGPAMKVKYERVGWTLSGSFSHRSGRNLKKHSVWSLWHRDTDDAYSSASAPQNPWYVLTTLTYRIVSWLIAWKGACGTYSDVQECVLRDNHSVNGIGFRNLP